MTGRVKITRRRAKHATHQRYSRRVLMTDSGTVDERCCSAKESRTSARQRPNKPERPVWH